MNRLLVMTGTLVLLPVTVEASVTITEVAWMGTEAAATDEWIELHNSGSAPVDLTGWTLSDGENLTIELSGTIGAGKFVILERTDDSTVPGPAFLIYTGALPNRGATLALTDAAGRVVDEVVGGANWHELGGNNATKATPQRTESGWVTAAPTPGAPAPETGGLVGTAATGAFSFASSEGLADSEGERPSSTVLTAAPASPAAGRAGWPYLGLAGVLALGVFGALAGRQRNEGGGNLVVFSDHGR